MLNKFEDESIGVHPDSDKEILISSVVLESGDFVSIQKLKNIVDLDAKRLSAAANKYREYLIEKYSLRQKDVRVLKINSKHLYYTGGGQWCIAVSIYIPDRHCGQMIIKNEDLQEAY